MEEAAQHTRLWWGAAFVMATAAWVAGTPAAAAGVVSMAVAEAVANGVVKQLWERRHFAGVDLAGGGP